MSGEKQQLLDKENSKHVITSQQKSTCMIIFHAIIASTGGFFTGYASGELNMAHDTLDLKYGIAEEQSNLAYGYITSSMPLGAAIGSILAGIMLNKMSRRAVFYTADIVGIVTCTMFIYKNFYLAVILRFIMGLIVGLNSTVVPLYLREISPVSITGVVGIMNQGTINLGLLVGYFFGLGFPLEHEDLVNSGEFYWRFVLFFPVIPCLIRMIGITFIFRHDTPQYYLKEGQIGKAQDSIKSTYREEFRQEVFQTLSLEAEQKKQRVDTWKLAFSKKYRSRLALGSLLQVIKQFSGISAILYYSATIFLQCLGNKQLANYMAVVSGFTLMASSFVSGCFTKKYGRRPILLIGEFILVIALVLVGTASFLTKDQVAQENVSLQNSIIIISLIFLYNIVFNLSIGPLAWVYNADILNSEKALGFATAINWVCAFIVGLVFPALQDAVGIYTTFFMFAGCGFLGFIYFKFALKETKGLNQYEIIAMFTKNQRDTDDSNYDNDDDEVLTSASKDDRVRKESIFDM